MKRQPAGGAVRHAARRHNGTGNQPAMPRDSENQRETGLQCRIAANFNSLLDRAVLVAGRD